MPDLADVQPGQGGRRLCPQRRERGDRCLRRHVRKTETDDAGKETAERIPFLKAYTVFNAEQVEGLPGHYYAPSGADDEFERTARTRRSVLCRDQGGHAARRQPERITLPAPDFIQLPPYDSFANRETYYATRAHESIHWTKHERRLNRSFESKRFGDHGYAVEELVAELGAAFLCADLGITPEVMPEHASYLQAWLTVMKADKRAIFTVASHASKAGDYLHGLQTSPQQ